jgi:hypothetical protein
MNLQEMLHFSGSVLGPALMAQAFADLAASVPILVPGPPALPTSRVGGEAVDRLLQQALPDGLTL